MLAEHEKNKIMHKLGTMVAVDARTAMAGHPAGLSNVPGNGWLAGYVQVNSEKEASGSCVPRGWGFLK